MFRNVILAALGVGIATSGGNCLWANVIPVAPITIDTLSDTGTSFGYVGTLTQNDSLQLNVSGNPCLQSGAYCVNPAGVVVVPGTLGVGAAFAFTDTFGGTSGTWNAGALAMEISGTTSYTVQVFPADAANGLGSGSPPMSLTLPETTLSALGFPSFSDVNPTITFFMLDNLYPDNSGQFYLSQSSPVPEPTTVSVVGLLVCVLAGVVRRTRAVRN